MFFSLVCIQAGTKKTCIFFWILAMTLDELSAIQQIHPEVQALQKEETQSSIYQCLSNIWRLKLSLGNPYMLTLTAKHLWRHKVTTVTPI